MVLRVWQTKAPINRSVNRIATQGLVQQQNTPQNKFISEESRRLQIQSAETKRKLEEVEKALQKPKGELNLNSQDPNSIGRLIGEDLRSRQDVLNAQTRLMKEVDRIDRELGTLGIVQEQIKGYEIDDQKVSDYYKELGQARREN